MLLKLQQRSLHRVGAAGRMLIGLGLVSVALANVITTLATHPWQQVVMVENVVDLDVLGWGKEGTIAICAVLLLVARALMRGKRQAWWLALGLVAFAVFSVAVSRTQHIYALVATLLFAALLALAPLFPARSDPRALRRGYFALAVSAICLVTLRIVRYTWLSDVPRNVFFNGHHGNEPRLLAIVLLRTLLFLFLGFGVAEILRPVLAVGRLQQDDRLRAQAIVQRHGSLSMAHFALGADKIYFWSRSGRSLLAYRLIAGVALVVGDPIGPEVERAALLAEFKTYCRRQDWQLALYQASPRALEAGRSLGMTAYKIGEEALVQVSEFSTAGKTGAPVRHSVTRARRDGLRVALWRGELLPDDVYAGMQNVSNAWLGKHRIHTQMGFSMGRFPIDWSPELLTAVALTAEGVVQAFLTWTPLYDGNGWSLDIMRRLKTASPGIMELLIAESMEWARARGYAQMSLGLAPLAGFDSTRDDGATTLGDDAVAQTCAPPISWLERSARFLHQHKLLLGNYSSLYAFKAKFHPKWEPRYLIVTDTRALPRIFTALMQAHGYTWLTMVGETWSGARASVSASWYNARKGRSASGSPPSAA